MLIASLGSNAPIITALREKIINREDKCPLAEELLDFCDLITQLNNIKYDSERNKRTVFSTLIALLRYPMLYQDFTHKNDGGDSKNNILNCCIKIIGLIAELEPNRFNLPNWFSECFIEFDELDMTREDVMYALSVESYIVIGLHIYPNTFYVPFIYSPIYFFIKHLSLLYNLLSCQELWAHSKGLTLAQELLYTLNNCSLDIHFIDLISKYPIDKSLLYIMKYSIKKNYRSQSLVIFQKFLDSFNSSGRYRMLFKILSDPGNIHGIQGFIIGLYKDYIHKGDTESFLGENLQRFLFKAIDCTLKQNEQTDLSENFDSLLSLLNFIRYLHIRDNTAIQKSGISNFMDKIKSNFLDRLEGCIFYWKSRYKIEYRQLKNNTENKPSLSEFDVKILNSIDEKIPPLPENHEEQTIISSLNNIDVIESVLSRLNNLISNE